MFTTSEFQPDTSRNLNQDDPFLFPPSPPGRGRALDASFPRLPSQTRAVSHPSRPTYTSERERNMLPRHSFPDVEYLNILSAYDSDTQATTAIEEYLDASLMAEQYLDLQNQCSNIHEGSFNTYNPSESSHSSPEVTDTGSGSSPRAEVFSTHSSPGYLLHDLPDSMETARPDFRFGHHHYYSGAHMRRSSADNSGYHDNFALPRLPSFHEPSSTHERPGNTWGYLSSSMPSIAQSGRFTVSQPPSPPASHHWNTFGQFPVAEDLHRWPQMFKINQVTGKRGGRPTKQKMSCFFCRQRKIGCTRPDEGEDDQTCNQCARRKIKCEYPLVSLRGQHTRNRLSSKKFLGLDEPTGNAVAPPKAPRPQ
ncbi:hypothetical protein C8F04DRAFT_1104136 [Mycena alexandri]|uniref:Zn(2)-C6 fungal-type domain-containing protein n=1 Tax=Mycena alexandri TaxID=1745969 RepID=A0AAD6SU31_9AGAR|nr:hypothetical protein C8F04DRAFT_1104136 [Mycena alexandri]